MKIRVMPTTVRRPGRVILPIKSERPTLVLLAGEGSTPRKRIGRGRQAA